MPALRTGVAPAAAAARVGLQVAGLDATEYIRGAKPKSASAFSKAASQASTRAPDTAASTLGTIAEGGRPAI